MMGIENRHLANTAVIIIAGKDHQRMLKLADEKWRETGYRPTR